MIFICFCIILAASESSSNSPVLNFSQFVRKVTWSGKYIWNYVVRGETRRDDGESSLSKDLCDAEEEMEEFQSSTNTRLTGVSTLYTVKSYQTYM